MPAFPLELISIISSIRGQPIPAPSELEFFFEITQEAAAKNFLVFKQYRFVLGRAIEVQKLSPLGHSSEFKKPHVLQKILKNHPLWARMERLLIEGSQWPLKEISKSNRVVDLQEALQFGNHRAPPASIIQHQHLRLHVQRLRRTCHILGSDQCPP
jgi:hypothetical protein